MHGIDMDALAAVFAPDTDFVNVIGQRWVGRQAIKDEHAANHATIFRKSRLTARHMSVQLISPGVAVVRFVSKLSHEMDETGHQMAPRYSLPTFILTGSGRDWLIVIAQDTDILTTISPADF